MVPQSFHLVANQIIIHSDGDVCTSKHDLVQSPLFAEVIRMYCDDLLARGCPLPIDSRREDGPPVRDLMHLLRALTESPLGQVISVLDYDPALRKPENIRRLHGFVEGLYDYWRGFQRFLVLHSKAGNRSFDQRPYRSFNRTAEALAHAVRSTYRDICENITGDHPRVYRQVAAGVNTGLIAIPAEIDLPGQYQRSLGQVPIIRQVWMTPPMIIDPPANSRSGHFQPVESNPLDHFTLDPRSYLCYPAQVGPMVIFIYFPERFISLGCALSNLFELATDEQCASRPDAVYVYGAPAKALDGFGSDPTVFFDDTENDLLVAALPAENRYGYFGYLRKMALTLHNILAMKQCRMPFHGAMVKITLRDGPSAGILIIGDTATGKSETLEALRCMAADRISEMRVIAEDMGSLEMTPDRGLVAYGTEIGSFIRLDDLQQGYAFGQLDRAIIMSPQTGNARVVLPVATQGEILKGQPVDFMLYANNHEEPDAKRPILERFETADQALAVFREGKAAASATDLVQNYFANPFGPPQYRTLHEGLAETCFRSGYSAGVFIGQLRTRLGIPGFETRGPEQAAQVLLDVVSQSKK